jgi:hypothetical protein
MPVPRGAPVTRARPFILRCARHSTRATRGLRFATVRQDGCRRFLGSWSLLRESSARDVDRAILGDVAARCAVPVLAAEMSPARWPSVRAHRCARPSVSRGLRPLIGRSAGRTPFEMPARQTDARGGRRGHSRCNSAPAVKKAVTQSFQTIGPSRRGACPSHGTGQLASTSRLPPRDGDASSFTLQRNLLSAP